MSLVAYEESDCESDEDNSTTVESENPSFNGIQTDTKIVGIKQLLTLPKPKSNINVQKSDDCDLVEEQPLDRLKKPTDISIQEKKDLLFPTLPKPRTGGKVKIIIPSLNEVFMFKKLIN